MFTPGDNDWTDCDRPSNGGFNSLERLDHERQLFFSTPNSLGQHQLAPGGADRIPLLPGLQLAMCHAGRLAGLRREPALDVRGVTYVTLNVQARATTSAITTGPGEEAARNAADIAWLQDRSLRRKPCTPWR